MLVRILEILAASSALGCLKLLADAQDWARENEAFGDWPAIPDELRPVRELEGGSSEQGGRARCRTVGHVWGHDGSATK